MLGLIYPLLGKGKTGDAQMKFFKENLFNPFSKAMDSLAAARVQLMADFEALKKNLDVPKDLQKEAFDGFTNEQVVRMYIWDKQGMDIPGISKRDLADASSLSLSLFSLYSIHFFKFLLTKPITSFLEPLAGILIRIFLPNLIFQ